MSDANNETPMRTSGPIAFMTNNTVAANLLMVVVLAGGLLGLTRTKQEVFPEFALDFVNVIVVYPGASPADVEQGIVLVTEEAVRGVDGVKRITSVAGEGRGTVNLEVNLGYDVDKVLDDVKTEVDRITSYPLEAERPTISLVSRKREVISLVLSGDEPLASMHRLAERARAALIDHPDVTQVEIFGVPPTEIAVEVPREKLERLKTGLDDIARLVQSSSLELPSGEIETKSGEVLLRVSDRRTDAKGIAELTLRPTRTGGDLTLGEVANIVDGYQDNDLSYAFNGRPAVKITAYRIGDETPTSVADAVKSYAEILRGEVPDTVDVTVWADDSQLLRDRIKLLVSNAIQGLILVLLILALFLDIRLALWVSIGIPTSFLGAFLFMPGFDISVNMVTLFAFIITLGMVVDDAIIVGENIFSKVEEGIPPLRAAITGAQEMAVPVTFAILTTVAAFSPLLVVPGVMGKIFRFIPLVVIAVLVISLIESFAILPAHLAHLKREGGAWTRPFAALQKAVDKLLKRFIAEVYEPALNKALTNRYTTMSVASAALILTIGLVAGGVVPFSFFPELEGDIVRATVRLPYGAPQEMADAAADALQESMNEAKAKVGEEFVIGSFTRLGEGPPAGGPSPMQEKGGHLVSVELSLVPSGDRSFSAEEFGNLWRKAMPDVPGAQALLISSSSGPSSGAAVDVQLRHRNTEVLAAASQELVETLRSFDQLTNIENGYSAGKPRIDFQLLPHARAMGLTTFDLARQLRSSFFGAEALREQRGRDEMKIMVRLPEDERASEEDLTDIKIRMPSGSLVPIGYVASSTRTRAPTEIRREDGSRTVNVVGQLVPGVPSAQPILAEMRAKVLPELIEKYAGLEASFVGQQRAQAEAFASLGQNFLFALFIIFALLAIPFRSYLQPLIVMSAIPFGIVGAILGHLALGYELSLISMMGIVALSGVVVNDSLVLIDAANGKRAEGVGPKASIIFAGSRRMRPILLTSLTTFFGLMPMVFETSVQARFLIPMAISLGFGVMFATVIALVVVPALYMILEDIRGFLGVPDPRDVPPASTTHAASTPHAASTTHAVLETGTPD